jgi:hypothetical protein
MPRQSGIRFRESDGYYYTTYRRKQHRLAQTKEAVELAYHQLWAKKLAEPEPPAAEKQAATKTPFAVIANALLEDGTGRARARPTGGERRFRVPDRGPQNAGAGSPAGCG